MTTYEAYQAAVERLRRVNGGEPATEVYGWRAHDAEYIEDYIAGDKATVYDALHDREPATVEWLREVHPEWNAMQVNDHVEFWIRTPSSFVALTNPTRGRVLMLLSVFGEGK